MKKSLLTTMGLMLITGIVEAREPVTSDTPAPNPTATERTMPDNTEINKRDRDERMLTPLDQSMAKEDQDITQAVRKSIMQQDLSMNGKNVKVITQNGEVTLRGPVESRAEAETIVNLTKAVPGVKTIHNQLEVK